MRIELADGTVAVTTVGEFAEAHSHDPRLCELVRWLDPCEVLTGVPTLGGPAKIKRTQGY